MARRERSRSGLQDSPAEREDTCAGRGNLSLRRPNRWVLALIPLVVAIIAFCAFSGALDAEFVNYDDDRLFTGNPMYRGFGAGELRWMFSTTYMGHYQPLTWLSSALDHAISGTDPSSYHRNNLILHALNALLVYFIALRLFTAARRERPEATGLRTRLAAAAAALLFAIHPLRVESVAWATERRDVLSTFFLLLAVLTYLRAVRPRSPELASGRWYLASCAALLLSLLSKAWGMSFVLIALLLDIYPLRRLPDRVGDWGSAAARPVWWQKAPYLILGIGAALVAGLSQHSSLQTMKSLSEWGLIERIVQAFYGLAFYAWKTLWPTGLVALYELPADLDPLATRYLLSYLAVLGGVVLLLFLRRRIPGLVVAAAAYAILLAPVLGFAQSGPQFVADKYSYVSCVGFAILGGAGLDWLYRRGTAVRTIAGVGSLTILVILFALTQRQTEVWQSSHTLWEHALAAGRPTSGAHLNYGMLQYNEGRKEEALHHCREAVEIRPDNGDAWFLLGNLLRRRQEYAAAEEAYCQAVATMPIKHRTYMNLGILLHSQGRTQEAIEAMRKAVEAVRPLSGSDEFTSRPYLLLGTLLAEQAEIKEARRWLEVAARFPDSRQAAQEQLARLP